MPVEPDQVKLYRSTHVAAGGPNPNAPYCGGPCDPADPLPCGTLHNLFEWPDTLSAYRLGYVVQYRCFHIANEGGQPVHNVTVHVASQSPTGSEVTYGYTVTGMGADPAGPAASPGSAAAIAADNVAPAGVTFLDILHFGTAELLVAATLSAGQTVAVWLRLSNHNQTAVPVAADMLAMTVHYDTDE